jgi:drug/metabolite transporter (DMT)-like permease
VLIKVGLRDIPALTFAGLRYTLAFLILLPLLLRSASINSLRAISRSNWISLLLLGLLFYSVTQGAQFVGLLYLPAVSVSLMLNFTPLIVAVLGISLLRERPTILQWMGVLLFLTGIATYFYPASLPAEETLGLLVMSVGVLANAASSLLGRHVNRSGDIDPLTVTTISMGIGSITLLLSGVLVQGMPPLSPVNWLIILWLAVVNTAFAFTLWNHTLRTLMAVESTLVNSTMLIQIAILAWIFLGESLTPQELMGLALAVIGIVLVQLRRPRLRPTMPTHT